MVITTKRILFIGAIFNKYYQT